MTDLTCMHRLSDVPHKLLLGGNQQQIIQFDVETQKEIRIVWFFLKLSTLNFIMNVNLTKLSGRQKLDQ